MEEQAEEKLVRPANKATTNKYYLQKFDAAISWSIQRKRLKESVWSNDLAMLFATYMDPVADPGCPPQGGLINRDLEQMSKINDEITSGGANQ